MEHMGKKERVRAEWGSHCQTSSGKSFLMIHLKFGPKILKVWVKCSCLESILHFSQLSHCCGGAMDTWWRKPIGTAGIPLGHHPYSTNVHSFLAQLHQCTRLLLFWRRVSNYLPRVSLKILLFFFFCICSESASAIKWLERKDCVWLLAEACAGFPMAYLYLMTSQQTVWDVAQHAMQRNGSNTVFPVKNLGMMLDWPHLTGWRLVKEAGPGKYGTHKCQLEMEQK